MPDLEVKLVIHLGDEANPEQALLKLNRSVEKLLEHWNKSYGDTEVDLTIRKRTSNTFEDKVRRLMGDLGFSD